MKISRSGRGGISMFQGGGKNAVLERKIERMEARIAELEQRLSRSETRFEMSIRFFEHRVDQIYARILPVLGREQGLFAGPEESVAAHVAVPAGSEAHGCTALDWQIDTDGGFLTPGRYAAPIADFGFRLALGLAVDRGGAIELVAGGRGAAVFGPYKRMSPGRYRLSWHLAPAEGADGADVALAFDLYSPTVDRVIARTDMKGRLETPCVKDLDATIGSDLSEALFELRVHQRGGAAARLTAIEIERS